MIVCWKRSLSRAGTSPVPLGRVLATAGAAAASAFLGWPLGPPPFCCCCACGFDVGAAGAFAMSSALVDRLAAAAADAHLAAVGQHLDPGAGRLVAAAADEQHVRERQRRLALDDAALSQLLRGPLVLLHHVDLLDDH